MRLTLRTLLAFRDGVLDENAGKILEKKIRSSSTAQGISQRIDAAMQNQRLAPIPTDAREFGFDANMIANYLDDTIAIDMLPEMERKCLENDAILGEVASCHQILSRVLSLPAAIPMSLRDRIHGLPSGDTSKPQSGGTSRHVDVAGRSLRIDSSDTPHITNQSTEAARHETQLPTEQVTYLSHSGVLNEEARPLPSASLKKTAVDIGGAGIELSDGLGRQVPEYLMGSGNGSWVLRALLAVTLLMALVLVSSIAIGPWDRLQALLDKTPDRVATTEPEARVPNKPSNDGSSPEKNEANVNKGAAATGSEKDKEEIREDSSPPPIPSKEQPRSNTNEQPPKVNPITASEVESVKQNDEPETLARIGQLRWLPETKTSSDSIVFVRNKMDGLDGADTGAWNRLAAGVVVGTRSSVVTPPTCRTEFRIEPGIQWTVCGDSELYPAGRSSSGRPVVGLVAGRAIVFASPDAKEIEIEAIGQRFAVGLDSVDGSCAIEVTHQLLPASEEQIAGNTIRVESQVAFLGIRGNIRIEKLVNEGDSTNAASQTPSESTVVLAVGERSVSNGTSFSAAELVNEMPWWLRTSAERPVDQMAANDLFKALSSNTEGSLLEELAKLCGNRRSETAAIAARTRMMLGEFDLVFEPDGVLNRRAMHSHWNALVQQIPQSLGGAEKLNRWIESVRRVAPDRADRLLSLVLPKTQEQLEGGADKMLVDSLASTNMDERVLAIHRLSKLTGKNMGYHPDKASNESLVLWKKALMKGEIRIAEPSPVPPKPNP